MSVSLVYQAFKFAVRISCFSLRESVCYEIEPFENLKIQHL